MNHNLAETSDLLDRAYRELSLSNIRQYHPVNNTVGYYDESTRVWCFDCYRSIDRAKDDTIYQKCPYCDSEKIPYLRDPLTRMFGLFIEDVNSGGGTIVNSFGIKIEKPHPKDD